MLYSNNFFPTITKPTRIPYFVHSKPTLIDHIYTNFIHPNEIKSGIGLFNYSDHLPIFTSIPCCVKRPKINIQVKRSFKNFNNDSFNNELKINLDSMNFDNNNSVDTLNNNFYDCFIKTYDKHAPMKKLTRKQKKAIESPWITKALHRSIDKKHRLYNSLYLKGNESSRKKYKKYSNLLSRLILHSKKSC